MSNDYQKASVALILGLSVLLSGCDNKDNAEVKTIVGFKDLTAPRFTDVVSTKADIANQWVKKDAFGTEQYEVIKTRKSPEGCKAGNYYYLADMREKTVQPLMASLCLADNITLSFREETNSYTGEKYVVYSHDGKEMGKVYLPQNQERHQ
ncbi:YfjS/YafY family lipoprotein [Xenorhabdus bovienii]|uniref:YfjS/YafY family lipoprotein n=1 Tax=Xenorhabdus bovienii TaxID=40576 RepID=UPI003DA42410